MTIFRKKKLSKRIIIVSLVVTYLCVAVIWSVAAIGQDTQGSKTLPKEGDPKNPSFIVLDDSESNPKRSKYAGTDRDQGKTPFDHDQHISIRASKTANSTCVTCHHTNSKKLTINMEESVRRCDECHKAEDSTCKLEGFNEDIKFNGKIAKWAKDAYHGTGDENKPNSKLAGCITCHDKYKVEVTCGQCHVKDTNKPTIEYGFKVDGLTYDKAKAAGKPETKPFVPTPAASPSSVSSK